PLLLVLVTVSEIVLRNHPDVQKQLLDSALSEFPVVGPTLPQSLKSPSGTGFALVVGIVGALWGASGLAGAVQSVLNQLWLVGGRHGPGVPLNYPLSVVRPR